MGNRDFRESELIEFVKEIPKKEISEGKNLLELMKYNDFSLWWFVEHDVFNGIKKSGSIYKLNPIFNRFAVFLIIMKVFVRCIFGNLVNFMYKKFGSKNKTKIMFLSYLVNWRSPNNPLKKHEEDVQIQPIIDALPKSFDFIGIDQDTSRYINFKKMIKKGMIEKNKWRPIECYLNFGILFRSLKAYFYFRKIWENLKNSKQFIDLFKFKKENLYNSVIPAWEDIFGFKIFYVMLYFNLLKNAIKIENPELIVITCEYSALGRAATIIGKKEKIPTLATMHGIFYTESLDYFHAKGEISEEDVVQHCVIPTVTAVYGRYYYRILTETCNYPRRSVIVTGQPRYDILSTPNKVFNKKEIYKKLKLDPNKKMIAWLTGSHDIPRDENERTFRAVYRGMKRLSDKYQLVIKVHHNEYDTSMHREIAKEEGVNPVIIKNINTFDVLYACDAMVTKDSTATIEAVVLDKPVVVLNLSEKKDLVPYVRDGIAFGVYNEEDFCPVMKEMFQDEKIIKTLIKNRNAFIVEHAYKKDGKSAGRVVELIKNMVKRQERNG
jgi:hypothetical protein